MRIACLVILLLICSSVVFAIKTHRNDVRHLMKARIVSKGQVHQLMGKQRMMQTNEPSEHHDAHDGHDHHDGDEHHGDEHHEEHHEEEHHEEHHEDPHHEEHEEHHEDANHEATPAPPSPPTEPVITPIAEVPVETPAQIAADVSQIEQQVDHLVSLAKTDEVVVAPAVPPTNVQEAQHDVEKLEEEIKDSKTVEAQLTTEEAHVDTVINEIENNEQALLKELADLQNPSPQQVEQINQELQKDMQEEQALDNERETLEENIVQIENAIANEDTQLATLEVLEGKEGENAQVENEVAFIKEELQALQKHDEDIVHEENHIEAEITELEPAEYMNSVTPHEHEEHHEEHEHSEHEEHEGHEEHEHEGHEGHDEHEHSQHSQQRSGPPQGGLAPTDPSAQGAPSH